MRCLPVGNETNLRLHMTSNSLQSACKRGLNQNDARFRIGFRNLPDFMPAPGTAPGAHGAGNRVSRDMNSPG